MVDSTTSNNTQETMRLDGQTGVLPLCVLWHRNCSAPYGRQISSFEPRGLNLQDTLDNARLGIRFFLHYYLWETVIRGNTPTFDPLRHNVSAPQDKGMPLGGVGAGSFTRSYTGETTRFQWVKPGVHCNVHRPVDHFSLRTRRRNAPAAAMVLNSNPEARKRQQRGGDPWSSWTAWGGEMQTAHDLGPMRDTTATYYALFPAAHYRYTQEENGLVMTCRQFSPVIGHNYRESSLPVALFEWELHNTAEGEGDEIEVSLMQSMQNGGYVVGDRHYKETRNQRQQQPVQVATHDGHKMVAMNSSWICKQYKDEIAVVLSAEALLQDDNTDDKGDSDATVSRCSFNPSSRKSCDRVWEEFVHNGTLDDQADNEVSGAPSSSAGAICVKVCIKPGETRRVRFAMVWHHPEITLGERRYRRRYTQFYTDPLVLARDAMQRSDQWYAQILNWQRSVISSAPHASKEHHNSDADEDVLPLWVRGHMFNELYYMTDGGTIWVHDMSDEPSNGDGTENIGRFVYQESHEYIMGNTYDVHFYASHAYIVNFPLIQLAIQRDYVKTVKMEHKERVVWFGTGDRSQRKTIGCLPHDVGTIDEDMWNQVNSYQIQDVNRWKDLNCMFVLSLFRDYKVTGDEDFLRHCYPSVVEVLRYHEQFDKDGDGVIENENFPDSTYDTWNVVGVSAFSGGLYIAANRTAAEMAHILGDTEAHDRYLELAERGTRSYEEKLWNGHYYNYDSSDSAHHNTVQSDMLHGHWMLRLCGIPPLLSKNRLVSALRKIYDLNVRQFAEEANDGRPYGCVNGMRPEGQVDRRFIQSREVWTGVCYTTAATMLLDGMTDEALEIVRGVKDSSWDRLGFWWQTPEAYHLNGDYRALGYMRPLSIWAIWLAQEQRKKKSTVV